MYFLAGVANAEIFKNNNLFATAKALTDSSISIGVSAEDVKGGEGAALRGKYFHSATFGLKMTSAMFELGYIAANIGSDISIGGDALTYKTGTVGADHTIELPTTAKPLSGTVVYAYAAPEGSDKFVTYTVDANNKITIAGAAQGAKYCLKYVETVSTARKIVVGGNFTPDTVYVILRADLFAGDTKETAQTKVGTVVIKVPRFQLNGTQELSMTMTGASTTSFEGSALAVESNDCDGKSYYAEILEIINGQRWFDICDTLAFDDSDMTISAGAVPANTLLNVYGFAQNIVPKRLSNAEISASEASFDVKSSLVFSIVDAGGSGLTIDSATGAISGTAVTGKSATFRVTAKLGSEAIPGLDAIAMVTVA